MCVCIYIYIYNANDRVSFVRLEGIVTTTGDRGSGGRENKISCTHGSPPLSSLRETPNKLSPAEQNVFGCLFEGPEGATLSWRISFSFAARFASESSPAPLAVNTVNQPLCSPPTAPCYFDTWLNITVAESNSSCEPVPPSCRRCLSVLSESSIR